MNPEIQTIENTGEVTLATPDQENVEAALSEKTSRCRHLYPNSRRCRVRAVQSGLCSRHFFESRVVKARTAPAPSDFEDLSADLLPGELSEFSSAADIRQFLARLLVQVTKGRISPRRASVLAFISSQLLHSNRADQREADSQPQEIIWDLPRPKRD